MSRKLFKGVTWLALSRLMLSGLNAVSTFVLARLLTPADFGIVAIAAAILSIATAVTDLSLGSALIQRSNLLDEHFHSVFSIGLVRSAAIFFGIAAGAVPLARLYGEPALVGVLTATAAAAALPALASPRLVMLTRSLVFWQEFAVQATRSLIVFAVAVVCGIIFRSYWALIAGNLAGAAALVVLSYVIAPYRPRVNFSKLRELFSFSLWLSLSNMVSVINWRMDQLILGYFVGKAQLGLYTVADTVSALPVRESTVPLTKTLFPAFARIADDPVRLRQAYLRSHAIVCAVALPVGFGFAAVAAPAVKMFLGVRWIGAIPIIQILSITFALQMLSNGLQPLAMSVKATRRLFERDVRSFLIRVPFFIIGYLWNGLLGVVIGRAIASIIGTVWNMTLIAALSGLSVSEQVRHCWRPIVSSAAMLACILLSGPLLARIAISSLAELAASVSIGLFVYFGTSTILWLMSGRPAAPEQEILAVARSFMSKRRALGAT